MTTKIIKYLTKREDEGMQETLSCNPSKFYMCLILSCLNGRGQVTEWQV